MTRVEDQNVVSSVSQSGEASTRTVSSRLSRPVATNSPIATSKNAEQRLAAVAGFHQAAAPAHHRLARQQAEQHQRQRGADAEREHGQRHLAEILALGGEQRGGAERRPDARAPHRAEQKAEPELAGEAARREVVDSRSSAQLLTGPPRARIAPEASAPAARGRPRSAARPRWCGRRRCRGRRRSRWSRRTGRW